MTDIKNNAGDDIIRVTGTADGADTVADQFAENQEIQCGGMAGGSKVCDHILINRNISLVIMVLKAME